MSADPAATATLPPAADDGLDAGRRIGPYRIERRLGEGGMGMVVLGVHELLQRRTALKIMRPELAADRAYLERFLREARAAAAVTHPNLVAIHDAGQDGGRTWLAFEFVSGGDLDLVLARDGPMTAADALSVIAACADGLQALHEAGLVHRDIKPHNIFVDARGRPRLGDFGLARQADGGDRLTMTGTGMGTPAYMSPEQANGDPGVDIRADIHALGGTLYTLLTRRTPYTGATPWAVVNAVLNEPPPDPRRVRADLPAEPSAIVARAMAKRREERYQTPAELADACRGALVRLRGAPVPPPPSLPPGEGGFLGPFAGNGAWWLGAAAAALLLLPLGLHPLCALDPGWDAPGYASPGLWGTWIAHSAAAAALLWTPLRQARGDRIGRTGLAVATMLGAGVGCLLLWCASIAVLDAAAAGRGWHTVASVATAGAGAAWLAWWCRDAWRARQGLVREQLTRLAQVAIPLLAATIAGHLIAAGAPDEPRPWASRLAGQAQARQAAEALALAVPLCLALVAPLLRARTVPR